MLLRPYQQELIDWCLSKNDGKPIAIAAPTGSGKTHILKGLADKLPGRTAILTLSNALVGQFIREFPLPALIGASNYMEAGMYEAAKEQAKKSPQVIFNPASYISFMNKHEAHFDNVIIDEADSCMGLFRILVPKSVPWLEGLPVTVENIVEQLIQNNFESFAYYFRVHQSHYWWELVETKSKKKDKEKEYTVKLHGVALDSSFAKTFLPKRIIGLSGTMFPSFCEELFGTKDYHYKEIPSPIPVERRRVEAFTQDEALAFPTDYEEMVALLEAVLKKYPQRPAIVHVTYRDVETVKAISEYLKGYSAKEDKMIALEDVEGTEDVLLTPGAVEGLNLKDDKCRLNIILRAGFPNKGADSVSKRLALPGGNQWYVEQALRNAVQASGRSTRTPEDSSVTVIADCRLSKLIANNKDLIPQYFLDACSFVSPTK